MCKFKRAVCKLTLSIFNTVATMWKLLTHTFKHAECKWTILIAVDVEEWKRLVLMPCRE